MSAQLIEEIKARRFYAVDLRTGAPVPFVSQPVVV